MRVTFGFERGPLSAFNGNLEAIITKVGKDTRKGMVEACREISDESLQQVPYDTGTLASSQYFEITGSYKLGWRGNIGYGGNGDPVNPKTGKRASSYMIAVHEDLTAAHLLGKAKYLEDPVRAYAAEKFPRTAFKYVPAALRGNK